jgi:sulfur-carrier protein
MSMVTLRYWAAAKEAAGIAEETVDAGTLAEALAAARGGAGHTGEVRDGGEGGYGGEAGDGGEAGGNGQGGQNPRLRAVLARSSFLIDGDPVGKRPPESVVLGQACVIEVLPPFAGG